MTKNLIIIFFLLGLVFNSCNYFNEPNPFYKPELPESTTFIFDASVLEDDTVEPEMKLFMNNWLNASRKISLWTIFLEEKIEITQKLLEAAYNSPQFEYYANNTWIYKYDFIYNLTDFEIVLYATFEADSSVLWEMYTSVNGGENYLAMTGESNKSNTQGNWEFYSYTDVSNIALKIDWLKTEEYVLLTFYNLCNLSIFKASNLSLEYFSSDTCKYDLLINSYNSIFDSYSEMRVNTKEYFGSIKSPLNYEDSLWHCWNSSLIDDDCEKISQ